MNVLYKYCDQLGIVKILGSLELKLPNISEVNDPLELSPFFDSPYDKDAMKASCLRTFKRNNIEPRPANWEQLNGQFERGELQEKIKDGLRKTLYALRQKSFLLSVSQKARSTVMWAHYADKHKGVVIGIDFNNIFPNLGVPMHRVTYSKHRPRINIWDDFESEEFGEIYRNMLSTKSDEWIYEEEFRNTFSDDYLMGLKQQGFASIKDFNGRPTWFLRLNPESIREVIFGLYTEDSLKSAIAKLIERPELQHVRLLQCEESETYTLNLVDYGV